MLVYEFSFVLFDSRTYDLVVVFISPHAGINNLDDSFRIYVVPINMTCRACDKGFRILMISKHQHFERI